MRKIPLYRCDNCGIEVAKRAMRGKICRWCAGDSPRKRGRPRGSRVRITCYARERDSFEHPYFGIVTRVQIGRDDGRPMRWSDVQRVFNERFPDRWAIEMRPPEHLVVDEINAYHLFVLADGVDPEPLRIDGRLIR